MADIQREIDEVRSFMDSSELTASDRIRHAAAAYASACHEANRRLSRCAELLNKGLRGEAIHQAAIDPSLLDLTALLDFPGCERWIAVAASYGLSAPPRLAWKFAEELNQAYAQEKPLEELMKKHRLLALARASLHERVPILRRIAELDNLNPVWDDDIRQYEKSRLRDLSQEFQTALKANDQDRLLELQQEITAPGWREAIPMELASKITDKAMKIDRERVVERFAKLEASFNEATQVMDLDAAKQNRDNIIEATEQERLAPDDPLLTRLQSGLDWLARKEKTKARHIKFEAGLDQFEAALRAKRPFANLQEQHRRLLEFDEKVPRELEEAYRDRERRQRRNRLVKRVLITVAILVVVGGSAIGGVMWMTEQSFNKKTEEARTKLDAFMKAESYTEARGYIEDISRREPKVADALDVRSVIRKLDEIDKTKQERTEGFADAFRKAEELPLGDPSEYATITQLKRLASTPSEKASAALYTDKREAHRKKQTLTVEERAQDILRGQLTELESELPAVRLGTYDKTLLEESQRALADLKKRLIPIETQAASLSPILKNAAENIRAKFDKAEQALAQTFKEIQSLEAVTRSLTVNADNMETYSAALMAAAKSFIDGERRKGFEESAGEVKTWEMLIAWEKALAGAKTDYLLLKDVVAAETRAKQISDLADRLIEELQNAGSPISSMLVIEYIDSLKATAAQAKCVEALRELFSREDVRGLHVLRSMDGKTFYMKDNPDEKVNKAKAASKGGIAALIRYRSLGSTADIFMKLADYKEHGTAPQSDLADKVLIDLRGIEQINTDEFAVKLIEERIRNCKNLDPILAVILIRKTMELVSTADTALAAELAKPASLIEDAIKSGVDLNVPWLDPDRADSKRVRTAAGKFLAGLPSLKTVPEAVQKRRAALELQLKRSRYQVAGWLHRTPDSGWKVVAVNPLKPTGEMKVMAFKGGKPSSWVDIGKMKSGVPALSPNTTGSLMEGRLVFIPAE